MLFRSDWNSNSKIILFAGAFDNAIKNFHLAKSAVEKLNYKVELKELKGYSREEVAIAMGGADLLLLTSFSEGSPQVVKEAIYCGCPVVSVDVGDVKEVISNYKCCFVSKNNSDITKNIDTVLKNNIRITECENKLNFSNSFVSNTLVDIYHKIKTN